MRIGPFPLMSLSLAIIAIALLSCGKTSKEAAEPADDDVSDDDSEPTQLKIDEVVPSRAGASVSTDVTIYGDGFKEGLVVTVGNIPVESVTVISSTEANAVFPSIPLTDCGLKDVVVTLGDQRAILPNGFEYFFDEDPIVFVHGYFVTAREWDVMIGRFKELGYPEDYLAAIQFSDNIGSNIPNAKDELPPFVDEILEKTGAEKVDIVAHSMGGLSTRLWIKLYGGADKVRDYVTIAGTHHGSVMACLIGWIGEAAKEMCPAYASEDESYNGVQRELNGDPDSADVDETPFGVEDGGGIYWNSVWTDADTMVVPPTSSCLNQKFRNDCSDQLNIMVHGVEHLQMQTDEGVFEIVKSLVQKHNASKP